MHSKEADAMANSVDPDPTASEEAVWSWSALFAETYLSQYIEFLRYVETRFNKLETLFLKYFRSGAGPAGLMLSSWFVLRPILFRQIFIKHKPTQWRKQFNRKKTN